ncbi:G-D-S-L family lipolytic protein [Chitinophaga costaii]|nr:GDSL-type esterase/lipase family protein [Chitinophaga costaii]PUZ30603.1 G-D-S-L family lipolytic protein [Chitinophaga costaii]
MKKLTVLALLAGALTLAAFKTAKVKKIVFFGDSITQMGVQPGGYVDLIKSNLLKQGNKNYEVVGAGIGGNKVYDLYLRMDDDVLAQHPDITVIWVGVNDVWHKSSFGTGTDPDKFVKFYTAIIKKLQEHHSKVIVVTPATIGEKKNGENKQDSDLDKYSESIRQLAAAQQIPVVDLRKIFTEYEATHNTSDVEKGVLTVDGVHLNATGNQLVAEKMWDAIKSIE